jgi:ubiquitin-conjugating enzyme E2 H
MSWQKRLARDLQELRDNKFEIQLDETELNVFIVILNGPPDTPYQNGSWRIRFTISSEFPFKSPSVGFIDHVLHPNIDWASGSVCLDALNKKWTPVITLSHIMDTLLPFLLAYPNPDDPLNRDAAAMFMQTKDLYNLKVIETIKTHGYNKKTF